MITMRRFFLATGLLLAATTTQAHMLKVADDMVEHTQAQFAAELQAQIVYQAMADFCTLRDWPGAANFFTKQAAEEGAHAAMIRQHLLSAGIEVGRPELSPFTDLPETVWDLFAISLDFEISMSKHVRAGLYKARDVKDFYSESLFSKLAEEQIEEEQMFGELATLAKRASNDHVAKLRLDERLAQRKK